MEQMFRVHCYAFFQEFFEFTQSLWKTIKSFFKLGLKLARLVYSVLENGAYLVFPQPTLYRHDSPGKREVIDRKPNTINWMRTF
jgi:hypothetical protein